MFNRARFNTALFGGYSCVTEVEGCTITCDTASVNVSASSVLEWESVSSTFTAAADVQATSTIPAGVAAASIAASEWTVRASSVIHSGAPTTSIAATDGAVLTSSTVYSAGAVASLTQVALTARASSNVLIPQASLDAIATSSEVNTTANVYIDFALMQPHLVAPAVQTACILDAPHLEIQCASHVIKPATDKTVVAQKATAISRMQVLSVTTDANMRSEGAHMGISAMFTALAVLLRPKRAINSAIDTRVQSNSTIKHIRKNSVLSGKK